MNRAIIQRMIILNLLILVALCTVGQQKAGDSAFAMREFAKLGRIYKQLPLSLTIRLKNSAAPITADADTMHAVMDLYYGQRDFYLRSEGMEEIVNDSLVILVNNAVKQIILYPNKPEMLKTMQAKASLFMPDSAIETMSARYLAGIYEAGQGNRQITLRSREMIGNTATPKEVITVVYKSNNYETITFSQTKAKLVLTDSLVSTRLTNDPLYAGRFISTSTEKGNLFFLVKELTTTYTFQKVDHAILKAPVSQADRVIRNAAGEYMPAKGFTDYQIRKEL